MRQNRFLNIFLKSIFVLSKPCLLTQGWSISSWDRGRSGGAEVVVAAVAAAESVPVAAVAGGNAGSGGWREAA